MLDDDGCAMRAITQECWIDLLGRHQTAAVHQPAEHAAVADEGVVGQRAGGDGAEDAAIVFKHLAGRVSERTGLDSGHSSASLIVRRILGIAR